jgi:hypothetical protein
MMTRALAQNLVAIGMADLIKRMFYVSENCRYGSHHGCCQDQSTDTLGNALTLLGDDIYIKRIDTCQARVILPQ